jgi:hypothetical protein
LSLLAPNARKPSYATVYVSRHFMVAAAAAVAVAVVVVVVK